MEDTLPPSNTATSRAGADLKIVFSCPDCHAAGWVYWSQVPKGMHCHGCAGSFWIGSNGQLHSERTARKIRLACPRCGAIERVPAELIGSGIVCRGCSHRIQAPSNAPRNVEAAAVPKRQANDGTRRSSAHVTAGSIARIRWLAGVGLLLVGLVVLAICFRPRSDVDLLSAEVARFTQAALAGNKELASTLVASGQDKLFSVWKTWAIPGKAGDAGSTTRASVSIRSLRHSGDTAVVRLEIEGNTCGHFLQSQTWSRGTDGRWYFDAKSSLQAIRGE